MIRRLLRHASPTARRLLLSVMVLVTVSAVLQGVAFLLLVPVLRALLAGDADALDRSGAVAGIATQGAMFVSTSPYRVVRQVIVAFVTPGTVLVGMWFFDWRLALAMTASVPVLMLAYRWLRRTIGAGDAAHAETVSDASNRVIEFARIQPALRTAGEGSIADRMVHDALAEQHHAYRGLLTGGGAGIGVFGGVVQLGFTALIVVGAFLAVGGTVDPATLVALLVLGARFNEPLVSGGDLGGSIAVARNTLDQLDHLDAVATLPEPVQARTPADTTIAFRDVTFGYGGDAVLRGLSFTVPAGTMTAVVGPSGSGKTTITKLIARFYDPEAGTVSIGGVPLPELGTNVVEGLVAPVFQDVYLFDDSILANVWPGNPDLTRDEVIAAATRARVDEIAERLPGGWDAHVGEGGTNLSGGERQRVSIARALLKDAPIVLLDEATAALDIGNELAIGAAVDAIRPGRTLVVVAHRLQTIMTADQIVMLSADGSVAESGSHAELLAADGTYARYWRERTAAAGWQLARHSTDPDREEHP